MWGEMMFQNDMQLYWETLCLLASAMKGAVTRMQSTEDTGLHEM